MSTPGYQSIAEVLKAEGNACHQKGLYSEAYSKYSDAIKKDGSNAILYANRAASALSMSWYLDAVRDAQEAVKIDPIYVKAWARLTKAYQDFQQGVQIMRETKTTTAGDVTTGILWDYRVFFTDSWDWNEKLHEQVAFELHVNNGWRWDAEYPIHIREEACQRLKESGWDSLRPAIETTMQSVLLSYTTRYQYFKLALLSGTIRGQKHYRAWDFTTSARDGHRQGYREEVLFRRSGSLYEVWLFDCWIITPSTALMQALGAYWRGVATVHTTLPLCERINYLLGKNAWTIWEMMADTASFQVPTEQAVGFVIAVDAALRVGKVTMDHAVLPRGDDEKSATDNLDTESEDDSEWE
ncbi:hypothetical protein SERLADRAFT_442779 [Serpula lacrymans var. lacrymans S7.9]|uniref:Uncharacterized protein n=1 Tax=Serpula lacrymans var. lacrymans (strain S7.9) TaxID=578457 RepID=F8P9W9_SERL9|nr:uncharacterized protein SERLADRAFT_442779 [Serpula lacrymans var. lacrymans S7.9]EGO19967.1 hypothetical protein SERLADRAFT_442779 [Serpula lacrymans var. lacrymans S7.9]